MEIVVAFVMTLTSAFGPGGTLKTDIEPAYMTIDSCLEQALEINSSPSEFFMVCVPMINKDVDIES